MTILNLWSWIDMKLYKLTFRPISSLTRIPDAQTIFGSVCSILVHTQGEQKLQEYFNSLLSNQPIFVHSSMFVDNVLPMPKIGLISIHDKNQRVTNLSPKEQLKYITSLKELKTIEYISIDVYKKYILTNQFENLKNDILNHKLYVQDGIVSNENTFYPMKKQLFVHTNRATDLDDKKLFYDENLFMSNNAKLCMYVKTDDKDYVDNIFKYIPYFGIGNRITIGKNGFKFLKMEEIHAPNYQNEYRVLLSKCLDASDFDLDESSYMIESTLYSGAKYYSSNKIGRFNPFIEGSFMKVRQSRQYYGKILKTNNGKDIYHYGIGFVL